jgi:hypothetical protein
MSSIGPYGAQRKGRFAIVLVMNPSVRGDQSGNIQQLYWLQSRMEVNGVAGRLNSSFTLNIDSIRIS